MNTKATPMWNSRKRCTSEIASPTKKVLICMADGSEPLDVLHAVDVFSRFPQTTTTMASTQPKKLIHLKDSFSITSEISFSQAESQAWNVIVLPGGNQGVAHMLEDASFVTLMVQSKQPDASTLLAAMGASATKLLPALGLVDPLGPSCYPPRNCTVVVREGDFVWTAPGLGTATELLLAVSQHVFGNKEASRVDEQHFKRTAVCHTENMCRSPTRDPPAFDNANAIGSNNERNPTTPKKINTIAFREVVWPALTELGWTSGFDTTWYYRNTKNENFQSQGAVILHLENQADEVSVNLMQQYRATRDQPSTMEGKYESDPLFEHIVWKRLQALGWGRKRHKNSYFLVTPENSSGRRQKLSEEEVIPFLLQDTDWRYKLESLAIVDLYRNCQQTLTKTGGTDVDPFLVEQETKKRMPAMELY